MKGLKRFLVMAVIICMVAFIPIMVNQLPAQDYGAAAGSGTAGGGTTRVSDIEGGHTSQDSVNGATRGATPETGNEGNVMEAPSSPSEGTTAPGTTPETAPETPPSTDMGTSRGAANMGTTPPPGGYSPSESTGGSTSGGGTSGAGMR